MCTFEKDECDWLEADKDDADWQRKSGPSHTNSTGPQADHTLGNSEGQSHLLGEY